MYVDEEKGVTHYSWSRTIALDAIGDALYLQFLPAASKYHVAAEGTHGQETEWMIEVPLDAYR